MTKDLSEIIIGALMILAVFGMYGSCKMGSIVGTEKGKQEICEQVCPTDIARIRNNKCECVIEEVRSPLRIELR